MLIDEIRTLPSENILTLKTDFYMSARPKF